MTGVGNKMKNNENKFSVAVIGAGMAGSECAWVLCEKYGISVSLFEMKSIKPTPAQVTPHLFAELVCSNSLKSKSRLNPAGILKQEIAKLGSLIIPAAFDTEVPAGETLAVDREKFSSLITQKLKTHKNIKVCDVIIENIEQIFSYENFDAVVIATGPLTDHALSEDLIKITNSKDLYFYDAVAPIIDGESIDNSIAFKANRKTRTQAYEQRQLSSRGEPSSESAGSSLQKYDVAAAIDPPVAPSCGGYTGDDTGDYLNLPLNKEEYFEFVRKVVAGDKVPHHEFEEPRYFNGCQPIEVLAERGEKTLAFGPMKPIGLEDPRTGRRPYAVVQLRKENLGDTAWNMVGFQSRLTWTAQKQIFKTLPGLQNAEFFRMGSMHRNTYMVSPNILNSDFSFKADSRLYLAGQIMGVEGYLESAAMGVFIAHVLGHKLVHNQNLPLPPANTSLGALAHFCLFTEAKYFSPMNINWGLFSDLSKEDIEKYSKNPEFDVGKKKLDKSLKRDLMASRAEELFDEWVSNSKTSGFQLT